MSWLDDMMASAQAAVGQQQQQASGAANPYSQWVTPSEQGNDSVAQYFAGGNRALSAGLLEQLIGGAGSLGDLSPEVLAQINEGINAYMQLAGSQTQDAYSQALAGAAARGNTGGTFEADIARRMAEGMSNNALQGSMYGNDLRNQAIQQQMQAYQLLSGLYGQQQGFSNQNRQMNQNWNIAKMQQPSDFQALLGGASDIGKGIGAF